MNRFFSDYKRLENKEVQVEEFQGKDKAFQIVKDAIQMYHDNFDEIHSPLKKVKSVS